MDPKILNQLALNSGLNTNDLSLLNQIMNSSNLKNKMSKMSAKEKNNLINKLSSSNTLNSLPQKELKDMNENEKKIYREEFLDEFGIKSKITIYSNGIVKFSNKLVTIRYLKNKKLLF